LARRAFDRVVQRGDQRLGLGHRVLVDVILGVVTRHVPHEHLLLDRLAGLGRVGDYLGHRAGADLHDQPVGHVHDPHPVPVPALPRLDPPVDHPRPDQAPLREAPVRAGRL
jgi:hypothetical protein